MNRIVVMFTLLCSVSCDRGIKEEGWSSESVLAGGAVSSSATPSYYPFMPAVSYENEEYSPKASHRTYTFTGTKTPPPLFRFPGVEAQYVKMPPWLPGRITNASPATKEVPRVTRPVTDTTAELPMLLTFSFDFRTSHPNGLLMYLDDGGPRDYLEIALHHRRVRLRFKFGASRSVMLNAGNSLNDGRWHSVSLQIQYPVVKLIVDGTAITGRANSMFGEFKSFIFLGGIPKTYKLQHLTLPSVYFDARFRGAIRRFAIDNKYILPVGKEKVVQETGTNICVGITNPCKNNGLCVIKADQPSCDCSGTAFGGKFCERTDIDETATFRGSQWFSYDLSSHPLSSFSDEISLAFKTRQRNGLLLHTGKSSDYVNLSIKNGALSLVINLGSGAYEVLVEQVQGRFNDNKWHQVKIRRELKQVEVTVDQANSKTGLTQNDYTQLTLDDVFYVGGSPATADLPGSSVVSNFMGCLREVTYKNKDTTLQLSKLARNRDRRIQVHGTIEYACSDVEVYGPVTFPTSKSYLSIRPWRDPARGMIALDFKTIESNGLILFAVGDATDYFALELYDGVVYVLIDLGSGTTKIRGNFPTQLNDGNWHHVVVQREVKRIMFRIDSYNTEVYLKGQATNLDVNFPLYLGGTDFDVLMLKEKIPKSLWTAVLQYGFVGCVRDVYVDSTGVDLQMLAKSKSDSSTTNIAPSCQDLNRKSCSSSPCKNGGSCKDGWSRFICDCSSTSYKGGTCEETVMTASFNGTQYLTRSMARQISTQAEEVSFRFRTFFSVGRLLTTISNTTTDQYNIDLVNGGQIRLSVNLGQGADNIYQGEGLNDGQWHTVKVWRLGRRVTLEVDGVRKGATLSGEHTELQFTSIYMGMDPRQVSTNTQSDVFPPYVGEMQNLIFNTQQIIDRCFFQKQSCKGNNAWGEGKVISNPVTFKDETSYIAIDTLDAYETTVTNGLLLYNAGQYGDFIAVELVSGFIHYVFNLGNGPQILSTPNQPNICDNKWHDIRITRSASNVHNLYVDDALITHKGLSIKRNLDLSGPLYIGGAREDIYFNNLPSEVASRTGYQGCLASFDLNGKITNIIDARLQTAGMIMPGCQGPFQACEKASCYNGGRCQQKWDSFTCDCSMTGFAGPRCTRSVLELNGGTAYLFGPDSGMMVYSWPTNSFPSSRTDHLALGFATRMRNAVLVKISNNAASSIQDYMQLDIDKGKLTLRFNTGNKDITLTEPKTVSDGQYHTIQVKRNGMNATIRVDTWPERSVAPSGLARSRFALAVSSVPPSIRPTINAWIRRKEERNTVFNSQATIQVGGKIDNIAAALQPGTSKPQKITKIIQPFKGQMMGLYFNDIQVFQLAAQGSNNINIIGDVKMIGGDATSNMLPPPGSISFYSSTMPNDILNPTTTMATMTTFSTTTRASREINETDEDSDCFGKELCGSASDKNGKPGEQKLPEPNEKNKNDAIPESSTKNGSQSLTDLTLNDGILVKGSNDDELYSKNKGSAGNNGSGNMILDSENVDEDDSTTIGGVMRGTVALVSGIVGAAVLCMLVLFVVMYRYKQRSYGGRIKQDDNIHNNIQSNNNNIKMSVHKNNHVNKNLNRPMKSDKEYYV